VGGLLQARFSCGLLSHQSPDASLREGSPSSAKLLPTLSRASPARAETPRCFPWSAAAPSPTTYLLPPRAPEPSIRTVGARRLGGPVAMKESITLGKVGGGGTRYLATAVTCRE